MYIAATDSLLQVRNTDANLFNPYVTISGGGGGGLGDGDGDFSDDGWGKVDTA